MPLSRQAIRALKAEAHRINLKPVVMIGQHGLSENVGNEIELALVSHELIKIRIPALEKAEKQQMIETICNDYKAELVQAIGHVIVIFRQNPKIRRFVKQLKQTATAE